MQKQMYQTIFIAAFTFCFLSAQTKNNSIVLGIKSFNGFQYYVNTKPNVDSALDCLRKLSTVDTVSLKMLLHDSFAQGFIQYDFSNLDTKEVYRDNLRTRAFNEKLLMRIIEDTTHLLVETAKPMYFLSRIQNAKNNTPKLKQLTNEFISTQLTPHQFYSNKTGRYGLMIYQIISKKPELKQLSDELFTSIKSNLDVRQIDAIKGFSRTDLLKRTWFRYIYASVHFLEAKKTKDIVLTERLLKTASMYSPDLTDENNRSAYFYEMFFIYAGPKESFKEDYLAFLQRASKNNDLIRNEYISYLSQSSERSKSLSTLLEMALVDPSYKEKLRSYYDKNTSTGTSFSEYWNNAIDSVSKIAPPISLKQFDGTIFSSSALKGKWIIVDFWGSWCRPCIKEHPDLQNYYDSVIQTNSDKISLMTIACKDTIPKVLRYMKENKYSFPVAMADKFIEGKYSISGYPTKILITPTGKYVVIPFGSDWRRFINEYADIQSMSYSH